jgi:hypothetical protein
MQNPKAFVSLNEATTQLAFGEPRSPSDELALLITDQHKLIKLIDESVHQSETSPQYKEFPRRLPFNPRTALIDRLSVCRSSWPPAARHLRAEAARQEAKWKRYDAAYDAASSRILEAAAEKKIDLTGQLSRAAGGEVRVIPWSDLLGQVTIDYQRAHLRPDTTAAGKARPYAILKCGPGIARSYYNVQLSRRQFLSVFKSLGLAEISQSRKHTMEKARNWYAERYSTWPKGIKPPNRDQDLAAGRGLFGAIITRDFIRHLRKEIAHDWTKPGRHKKVAKK